MSTAFPLDLELTYPVAVTGRVVVVLSLVLLDRVIVSRNHVRGPVRVYDVEASRVDLDIVLLLVAQMNLEIAGLGRCCGSEKTRRGEEKRSNLE